MQFQRNSIHNSGENVVAGSRGRKLAKHVFTDTKEVGREWEWEQGHPHIPLPVTYFSSIALPLEDSTATSWRPRVQIYELWGTLLIIGR